MKRKFIFTLSIFMIFTVLTACGTAAKVDESASPEPQVSTEDENELLDVETGEKDSGEYDADNNAVSEISLEELRELFSLEIETDGLSSDALYALGQQYEAGDGVVQWYAMAAAYYEAAADAGNANAAAAKEELEAHKEAMLRNSPDGQGDIFDFFRTGVSAGQEGNYEMAYAVFYDDAFFFEDPLYRGIGSLGDLLRDGTGVEQDVEKAVTIYMFNATVLGKGNGYTSLGLLYEAETGTYPGITQSIDTALEYYLLSYQGEMLEEIDFKGPRYAADLFDSGYNHDDGTFEAPDYARAEEGYTIASEGNGRTFDGTACYKLGTYYEEGREGIEQDYAKAIEYYLQAISDDNVHATMLGIPQTYLALGRFYENGLGLEKDTEVAIAYYTMALDAAQENLDLENAAGNQVAQSVFDEATASLDRLKNNQGV